MERKMNVAEFAALVGTTSKTIYGRIANYEDLPVNEKLKTVKEKFKGREILLIVTDDSQIKLYQEIYGKNTVNDGEYYEMFTDNNGYKQVNEVNEPVKNTNNEAFNADMFDKLMTLNNEYNNRLEQKMTELITVQKELATVKSNQLLLEDKAGREGLYLKEINELKTGNYNLEKVNNRLKVVIYTLITFIIMGLTVLLTYNFAVNNGQKQEEPQEVQTVQQPQPTPPKAKQTTYKRQK